MAKLRVNKIAAPIIKDEFTGSVFFDGTGDYLSVGNASDADWAFGTAPFTVEHWIYWRSVGNGQLLSPGMGNETNAWYWQYYSSQLQWGAQGVASDLTYSFTPTADTWYHIAVSRDSTNKMRFFIDGVEVASGIVTRNYVASASPLLIANGGAGNFQGYMSNVRICKGHAVYTENFTVPTRELEVHTKPPKGFVFPAADNVTVLLACQDAYNPLTEATGRHKITGAGHLSGDFGKNIVTNGDFTDGTTGWTGLSGATLSVENGKLKITESTGAADGYAVNGTAITTVVGVKYKIEWTFTEGTNTSFTVRFGNSGNQSQEYQSNSAAGGQYNDPGTYSFYFTATGTQLNLSFIVQQASTYGYVSNVSVVAIAPVSEANPGLLRKTNTTSTITETTGSVYFDGDGDYFDISKAPFQFLHKLTHAWTVECWFYKTSDAQGTLFDTGGSSGSAIGTAVYINSGGDVRLRIRQALSATVVSENNVGAASLHTWHHFALTFDGQVIRTFIDGAIISTVKYNAQSSTDSTQTLKIGVYEFSGTSKSGYYQGYISNFRICKGHAVYTSNFIPPTRELEVHPGPDDDRTVLLCCYDGENIFAEKTGDHIIAAYGDRTSSPTPTAAYSPVGSTTVTPGLTREVNPTPGSTFQGGAGFVSQGWLTLPKGTTEERFVKTTHEANPAPRGMRGSGQVAPNNAITNTMDSVEIATLGDAIDFGDLTEPKFGSGGIGSPTRGLFCGGGAPARKTIIEYFDIATRGNAQDFGDITGSARTLAGATGGNATRGLTFGGATVSSTSNVICAITISSTGSATDFGDCTKQNGSAVVCSPSRAVSAGGDSAANGSNINTIDFVTIQSMGNSLDFGDLLSAASGRGVSSTTRGLFSNETPASKRINYVTIATTGNAVDFGDLVSNNVSGGCASYSSLTRGCFAGLRTPTTTNTIEYVTMSTLGDALNFGDLTQLVANGGGCSNGHGGLG